MISRRSLSSLLLLLIAVTADARVLSYAPYSDQNAIPALQHRSSRHFLLLESPSGASPLAFAPLPFGPLQMQAVLYDSAGAEEPRVVYPSADKLTPITAAAMRENAVGAPVILLVVPDTSGQSAILSADGGATWKKVAGLPGNSILYPNFYEDHGGPFTRGATSQLRLGTDAWPFVVTLPAMQGTWAIGADGVAKRIHATSPTFDDTMLGGDRTGSSFLIADGNRLKAIDIDGHATDLGLLDLPTSMLYGWLTSDGAAYVVNGGSLYVYRNGERSLIAPMFFAIPTADYEGAWIIQRAPSQPTTLLRHTRSEGLKTMWTDVTGPEVEALHAGFSGTTLLVQVHRPRQQPERIFKDPALAVWHVGTPAPRDYDELFLNEAMTKGFLHVDVDRLEEGEPFVFDSGVTQVAIGIPFSPGAGGSDVVQEWGVVRGSLRQTLLLPGVGRTKGAFGSFWQTDVIVQNPSDRTQNVIVQYIPNGEPVIIASPPIVHLVTLSLGAHEVRVIKDVVKTLFGFESGMGALALAPDSGIAATSRTYTKTDKGTYGFGMNAIDIFAAASPRFPVTFAGAFPGRDFRTNLVLTDTSGRGGDARLNAVGVSGPIGASDVTFSAPAAGQQQFNGISTPLGLAAGESGGLVVQPTRGTMLASVFAIDNRTNDATYFPPDLASPVPRYIPAIGHLDGANNSKFRSDLYLYNSASTTMTVNLQANAWDQSRQGNVSFTLLPNEARVIRDALFTLFGMTGIARLRYQSTSFGPQGVKVTSRTYSLDDDGGTYGFLMPPLNNFQSATSGETLEILGATGDPKFRTNIGLISLTQNAVNQRNTTKIEIFDDKGAKLDSFTVDVPSAGGIQINDVFRARNLSETPAAVIRISPTGDLVGAYATVTDNGTNDSIYLAANLGSL